MLNHPTLHKLQELKLHGMVKELEEQRRSETANELSFEERLGIMVDREMVCREDRRFTSRLREAKLRLQATIEDIDYKAPRGLERSVIRSLAVCDWIKKHRNLLITGATGAGKTYLACAFGHQACRHGFRVRYYRSVKLFEDLELGRGDGRYLKIMARIAKYDLLIIDDWGLQGFSDSQRTDLLEILEDRHELKSTLITSQFPVDVWHKTIGNPTLADAILDRLVHNAHSINTKGDSMRKGRHVV
jgi:DNA replication protein DnaC